MATERLDKLLSFFTPLSRSQARDAVRTGRVTVDGVRVLDYAAKFNAENVTVQLDGEKIRKKRMVYLMLNKPAGFVTSTEERGQRTVLDLIKPDFSHYDLFPAGRLDKDTEGFLILTNDGDFCHRVISPKCETVKCYYLQSAEPLNNRDAEVLAEGVELKDGTKCRPARLEILPSCNEALIYVTEGKYHEVRRMIASRGNSVTYLKRLSIGGVELDRNLLPGEYRELDENEVLKIIG